MKRFAARLGRFFWSWRFLKIALWTATIIVLFYAEEDWRGARAWAGTKAKWEARGHSFDLDTYVPPPIPDDQNLAAIPLLRLARVEEGKSAHLEAVAWNKSSIKWDWSAEGLAFNNWMRGKAPDVERIRASLSADYLKAFGHAPSGDSLAQLEALVPFLVEIREVSVHRPLCRFDYDDTQAMPSGRTLSLVVTPIAISQAFAYHAILALDEHRPDLALADYEITSKLGAAAGQDPSLVGALVKIGVSSINLGIIHRGLELHAWSDGQLAEIDRQLAAIDFLALHQFSMGAEGAVSSTNLDWYKHHPLEVGPTLLGVENQSDHPPKTNFLDEQLRLSIWLWPRGWFDLNKAADADAILGEGKAIDVSAHRAYPNLIPPMEKIRNSFAGHLPWNVVWMTLTGPIEGEAIKFAYAQTRIDEARIACALERYRLAHQQYPASLDLLAPAYLKDVPHDVMTGQPYHYEVRPDGTFRLYSVGWNLTDEGGVQAFHFMPGNQPKRPSLDLEHGDWAWPVLK
jgi:hypothetical protein